LKTIASALDVSESSVPSRIRRQWRSDLRAALRSLDDSR
jgi:hypothetical protein